MNPLKVKEKLQSFLIEDIGERDISTGWLQDETTTVDVLAKQTGTLAGIGLLANGYQLLNEKIEVITYKSDGEVIVAGELLARIKGPASSVLSGERVLLNLIQRMSGIATATAAAVRELNDPNIKICDTRKTTPGLRLFEKYAVRCGGGVNHRYGLYDAVMIKDNHIDACGGSIHATVERAREVSGHLVKIEVEARDEEEVIAAVDAQADVIMFDNANPDTTRSWTRHIPETIATEASGSISPDTLSTYRGCGVDYISLGYLTHSVQALDISMNHTMEATDYVFS
ncbi:carboxylating nicotinate-nucleotide diphosphorylase [Natribacillus halophilus]|uniref:Probable nicotinate-nucleotide pyrophosphorylase [carboxylating] n=1 Tax=Natribacillus halophilus TaxID=549003 RepID=A0A1G8N3E2_9BACI|nr:carboxylating nicotinate-nucleotide diphosphorylase [Natribacillus halophilus]SDI74791.1 nicotinate-nucleotide pyrophosphorylase [carboxylating] [Natribacillus halophilus]